MKPLFVLLSFAAMCLQLVASESINWKDIGDKTQIIGKLGIPLGTVAEIEATVVGVAEFPQPLLLLQLSVNYFLKVESVGGKKLAARPLSFFRSGDDEETGRRLLPSDLMDLHRAKTGKEASRLMMADAKALERDYLGTRYRLLVYESGSFDGYPRIGMPDDVGWAQGLPDPTAPPESRFRTTIYVIKMLKQL